MTRRPPGASFQAEMQRYLSKITGPLLNRIAIHIEVTSQGTVLCACPFRLKRTI